MGDEWHSKDIVEKFCTCGKVSWDKDFGSYGEKHENKQGKQVPCDTNGGTYVNGVKQ